MSSKLDDLLTHIGTGRWSYLHTITLAYSFSLPAYQALAAAFIAPKLEFSCQHPGGDAASPNVTGSSQCFYTEDNSTTGTAEERKCTVWDFDNSTFTSTVTSEFDLVCGREYLRAMYTSMYMFGVFFGAPMNGFLADKYGRRPLVVVGGVAYVLVAIISTWLPNLSAVLGARFLLGAAHPLVMNSGYILAMEASEPRLRTALGITLYLPWALGSMALGGLAYLLRNWRALQLAISVIGVAMFPVFWFMDESPRWLMVTGKHERALKVLKKAAKWNKVALPPENELLALMKEELPPSKSDTSARDIKSLPKFSLTNALILFRHGNSNKKMYYHYAQGSLISWAPSVVFGAASLVMGLATVALPETLGMALPDTIADLEERGSGDSKRSFLPSFLKQSRPERN